MPLGLSRGSARIVPYDPTRALEYDAEKERLLGAFSSKIIAIEHIGSTAVPGMWAKPIIDMNVAIDSIEDISEFIEPLSQLGYQYMPERRFVDRFFFPKGPESLRTHHLNLVELGSGTGWLNSLLFRDYLRANGAAKDQYEVLKKNLALRHANDRDKYTTAKSNFIAEILSRVHREAPHALPW
jgi:GrpB-like predicted nucleotidyltransferase (UPF0157 family)